MGREYVTEGDEIHLGRFILSISGPGLTLIWDTGIQRGIWPLFPPGRRIVYFTMVWQTHKVVEVKMDRWRDFGMLLAVNQRVIELGRDLGVKCNDHERGILEFCQKQKQNMAC